MVIRILLLGFSLAIFVLGPITTKPAHIGANHVFAVAAK